MRERLIFTKEREQTPIIAVIVQAVGSTLLILKQLCCSTSTKIVMFLQVGLVDNIARHAAVIMLPKTGKARLHLQACSLLGFAISFVKSHGEELHAIIAQLITEIAFKELFPGLNGTSILNAKTAFIR